jgi:hypothetical protein
MAEDVNLNFLARQQERLLNEMAVIRNDMAGFRDEMTVQTAIIMRLEGSMSPVLQELRAIHSQIGRMEHRIRRLEETGLDT